MNDEQQPTVWAKLNAYGFVLAALSVLSLADLISPADTDLARAVGEIPPGQTWWTIGFAVGGFLMLFGFTRIDRIAETIGLSLLTVAVVAQSVVAFFYLGWTEYTFTRLAIIAIIGGCTWARVSVLWSREGVAITIPARRGERR